MAKKKIDLKLVVLYRFLRAYLPQLVVATPLIISFLMEHKDYLPLWVLPVATFLGAVVTAADKLYRELSKKA